VNSKRSGAEDRQVVAVVLAGVERGSFHLLQDGEGCLGPVGFVSALNFSDHLVDHRTIQMLHFADRRRGGIWNLSEEIVEAHQVTEAEAIFAEESLLIAVP